MPSNRYLLLFVVREKEGKSQVSLFVRIFLVVFFVSCLKFFIPPVLISITISVLFFECLRILFDYKLNAAWESWYCNFVVVLE